MKTASAVALPPGFRSTLFEGLTAPEIKAVPAAARQEKISPELLQQEGDSATRLWLVTGRTASISVYEPKRMDYTLNGE